MQTGSRLLFLAGLCGSLQACNNLARELPGSRWPAASGESSVALQAVPVVSGYRPYTGTWGPINGAYVEKVSLPNTGPLIAHFVKQGRSTTECGNPDAVVAVPSGGSLGPTELKAIFGVERPQRTVTFVACLTANTRLDLFNVNVQWHRPASGSARSSLAEASFAPRSAAAVEAAAVGGGGVCKNSANGAPVINDEGLFVCDLEAKTTHLQGLGVLSRIVKNVEVKTQISWDVFSILTDVSDQKMKFPEIRAEFKGESASGTVITGTVRLQPEVAFEGEDVCAVEFKDVHLNFVELTSPELSSFVTKSAQIALENNATLNRFLIQTVSSGFMTYLPKIMTCGES